MKIDSRGRDKPSLYVCSSCLANTQTRLAATGFCLLFVAFAIISDFVKIQIEDSKRATSAAQWTEIASGVVGIYAHKSDRR